MRVYSPLSRDALVGVEQYKYVSGGYTLVDTYIMTPFWNKAVTVLPLWMAPNTVTLTGLVMNFITFLLFAAYTPTLSEQAPRWVYVYSAFAMFAYQTMDAIDGKQARRTGAQSPLGQMFDHGCDAVNAGISVVSLCAALGMGHGPLTLAVFHLIAAPFFTSMWEEYHTGILRTGNVLYGVTEGQFVSCAINLLTATLGVGWWRLPVLTGVPVIGVVTRVGVVIGVVAVTNAILILGNAHSVLLHEGELPTSQVGRKELGGSVAVLHLAPYIAFVLLGSVWLAAPGHTGADQPLLFFTVHSALYALIVIRFIVAHMGKVPPSRELPILAAFSAVVFNAYFPIVDPVVVSILFVTSALVFKAAYIVSAIDQICSHLSIHCFSVKRRE